MENKDKVIVIEGGKYGKLTLVNWLSKNQQLIKSQWMQKDDEVDFSN